MEQRLNVVTLGVSDVATSTAFYKRLGWSPAKSASNQRITFFQMGGSVLALYGRKELAEDAMLPHWEGGFGGVTLAHNVGSRDNVDAALAAAKQAGARILKPAQDVFWGGYSGYFADSDGHPWEVVWNPYATFGKGGSLRLDV